MSTAPQAAPERALPEAEPLPDLERRGLFRATSARALGLVGALAVGGTFAVFSTDSSKLTTSRVDPSDDADPGSFALLQAVSSPVAASPPTFARRRAAQQVARLPAEGPPRGAAT